MLARYTADTHTHRHMIARALCPSRMCVYASIFEQTISTHMTVYVCVCVLGACVQAVFNNIKGFNRPKADMHRNVRLFICLRCFSVENALVCVNVCVRVSSSGSAAYLSRTTVRANARALIHASQCAYTDSPPHGRV